MFLDYDQDELDRVYDQQVWAPNRDHVITRNGRASEAVRARIGSPALQASSGRASATCASIDFSIRTSGDGAQLQ